MSNLLTVSETLSKPQTFSLSRFLPAFFAGLLMPLSFAPFHFPGAAILGLAIFYAQIQQGRARYAFFNGLSFGLGYFGLGISWVYISIHEYGHLNSIFSAFITFLFLSYLSLFPAFVGLIFKKLYTFESKLKATLLFSSLWIASEFFRATVLTGFPWLLVGFGQFDSTAKFLLPIFGVYGLSLITCLTACCLVHAVKDLKIKRYIWLFSLIFLLIAPVSLKGIRWSTESKDPISVGVIQANLSMRDKWDENLFWQLLERYKVNTEQLLGTQLIVMPESAIPVPASYVEEFLTDLDNKANEKGSAIMLGIPKPTSSEETNYYNALIGLGLAEGSYLKQHLVPFGEYIPSFLQKISARLAIPDANLKPGTKKQLLVKVAKHSIATLICYELAYGDLLRAQLPKAQWIVSISDDGWFGHSLAMYQQLQMAQVRALETGRYHVVANNDGLSAVINTLGQITSSLPAFSAGILKARLFAAEGITPWVRLGDYPILLLSFGLVIFFVARSLFDKS